LHKDFDVIANNYLIECSSSNFATLQDQIRRLLLSGVDSRLTPVSRNRALLPRHLIAAIKAQYGIDPWNYLKQAGLQIDQAYLIPDEDALKLVMYRATSELDIQAQITPAPVNGVQWHLANIKAPQAWALLGGPETIQWTCKVGQIDTGYTKHPAFGFTDGQVPWLDVAQCKNFYAGSGEFGAETGDPSGLDPLTGLSGGHGTRIGATISGFHKDGDSGTTFFGCAPKVPHVITRISNAVLINDQDAAFAEALNYLVNVCRVDVVNLSMGSVPRYLSKKAKAAVNNAYENGVILICAAGQHVSSVVGPACFGRTIAVGGTTSEDLLWAKTSRGVEIDWSAPAADIRRATSSKSQRPYRYEDNGDGTSYATALTSGAAALWLTFRGASMGHYTERWQRIEAFKALASATARIPPVWGPGVAGAGILDVFGLLSATVPAPGVLQKQVPL
jgi:Subtilase family